MSRGLGRGIFGITLAAGNAIRVFFHKLPAIAYKQPVRTTLD
jgi:hypothetical protein